MEGIVPPLKPRLVRLTVNLWFAGLTTYPFIWLCSGSEATEQHERVHYHQQDVWWRWAGPFGLIAWYFLYLCVLPVGWNHWRYRWEHEAYHIANKYSDETIHRILTRWGGLYKLGWM